MQEQIKALQSENESLKSKAAKEALGDVMDQVTDVGGVKLLAASVPGVDMNGLRDLGDQLKEKLGEGVVVLASDAGGKVSLVAMATDGAMAKGAHAGNLIKAIAGKVGGGGGGRPNMAQAGGKNPAGIPRCGRRGKDSAFGTVGVKWGKKDGRRHKKRGNWKKNPQIIPKDDGVFFSYGYLCNDCNGVDAVFAARCD